MSDEHPTPAEEVMLLAERIADNGKLPAPEVARAAHPLAEEVARLPAPLLRESLQRVLVGPHVDAALQWLHDAGALATLLPELEVTVDFTQEMGRRHKDVWKHTKQVLMQAANDPAVRWAALFHDIGKVPTRAITPTGKVTFHGHAEAGARMFDRVARRLAFPAELRSVVRALVLHHLRASQYDKSWTDSAVRRFDREMDPHLDLLLALSRADITSARRHKREAALSRIDDLLRRILALREIDSRVPPLPSGLGNHLMQRFGLAPGPAIGRLRERLEQAVESGELEPHQEADYYLAFIEDNGLLPEADQ
jgi:poly(A) polymerase